MRKWIHVLMLSAMAGSLLAGCSSSGTTSGTAVETPGTKSGATSSSPTPNGKAAGGEKVTLKLAHHMGEEGARLWVADFISKFKEKYPNVDVEVIATSYDNYHTMLKTKIASDDAPDIMLLARLGGSDKAYIDAGYIEDLTDQPFLNNVQGIENHKINGKVYGLPFDMNAYGVMYNKDVFTKAGITEVPRTYSAFKKVLEQLKQSGVAPVAAGFKELNVLGSDISTDIMNSQLAKNPNYRLEVEQRKIKFATDLSMRDSFTRLAERYRYAQQDPFGTDRTTYASLVASGKAAMLLNGSWMIDAIKAQNPSVNLGFFPYPYSENEADNKLPLGTGVGGWAVYKNSPHKEWALKLLDFVTSKEMGQSLQKNKKAVSIVKGLEKATDPTFQDIDKYKTNNQVYDYTSAYTSFSPEYNTAYLQQVSAFLMDPKKNVDILLKKLDEEFDRISKLNK